MCPSWFTLVLLVGGVRGLRWAKNFSGDEGPINVCSGQRIQLFWNFTLERGERMKGMVWGCQPEGEEEDVMASYVDDHFVPKSSFSGRLTHLQDAGIELSCATILESGNYTIAISTEDADNFLTVHRKTATVNVLDTPNTQTGHIHVNRKKEAVRDVTTGAWHVQLSCGNFSDRGHPPVDVIWTTPVGESLASTGYEEGFFHLLLPNPLKGGNYSCSIPSSQPAARCLPEDSPLLDTQSVEVEQTAARFSLLEARQQELMEQMNTLQQDLTEKMIARQEEMMAQLTSDRDDWRDAVENMANRTEELEQWKNELINNAVPTISFHARLTSHINTPSSATILKFGKVITNQGEGYDPSTGHFTAPVDGTYFFIGTAGTDSSGKYGSVRMMKEGSEVAKTYIRQDSDYYAVMGSCHAALRLEAGEKVWLESYNFPSYFWSGSTSFSGFRI